MVDLATNVVRMNPLNEFQSFTKEFLLGTTNSSDLFSNMPSTSSSSSSTSSNGSVPVQHQQLTLDNPIFSPAALFNSNNGTLNNNFDRKNPFQNNKLHTNNVNQNSTSSLASLRFPSNTFGNAIVPQMLPQRSENTNLDLDLRNGGDNSRAHSPSPSAAELVEEEKDYDEENDSDMDDDDEMSYVSSVISSHSPSESIPPTGAVGRPKGTIANDNSSSTIKRKRPTSKREPLPDEFSDEEEYDQAWTKWREDRDHNNRSVKRSRQRAKLKKLETGKATGSSKSSNSEDTKVETLKKDLRLLVKLHSGKRMPESQAKRARILLEMYGDDFDNESGTRSSARKNSTTTKAKAKAKAKKTATATKSRKSKRTR